MNLDKIEAVGEYKHLQIREIIQVPRVDEDGNPVLDDDTNQNEIYICGSYICV
jgi:hypothetical protein